LGLDLREADVTNFEPVLNRWMSARQALVAELLEDERFHHFYTDLCEVIGLERLTAALDEGSRCTVAMRPADEGKIGERVDIGNWLLDREFRLDLERYGYPLAKEPELSGLQLALSGQEAALKRNAEWLDSTPPDEAALGVHRSAEILALRVQMPQMASQLQTVGRSPVWRVVKGIEDARRRCFDSAGFSKGTGQPRIARNGPLRRTTLPSRR
jgi:hypothetical protein